MALASYPSIRSWLSVVVHLTQFGEHDERVSFAACGLVALLDERLRRAGGVETLPQQYGINAVISCRLGREHGLYAERTSRSTLVCPAVAGVGG